MDEAMEGSVSGLSSLEHDTDADDFDLRMLQTARDERRLKAAVRDRVHVFGKARTHPRVGLTMANLERSNTNANAMHRPSPSSSISSNGGSTKGEPPMYAPASWGSKSRTKRNWMRSIAWEPETGPARDIKPGIKTKPEPAIDMKPEPEHDASAEWDLTFELNEASMIASTPYIPRSTRLDDIRQRETDSQHLLRRLARLSHTPPITRPIRSLRRDTEPAPAESVPEAESHPELVTEPILEPELESEPQRKRSPKQEPKQEPEPDQFNTLSELKPQRDTTSIDKKLPLDTLSLETPIPDTPLPPKTPVVTGAWQDTPAPRPPPPNTILQRPRSTSPTKRTPQKQRTSATTVPVSSVPEEAPPVIAPPLSVIRPSLPTSALQALVCQAKSSDRRSSADYGDSTLNSLQDLITDAPDAALDEDTLQGLQLPTATPQNEAQRQRQQELLHLHRMNDRLRAARTSIRDASRGMKRVEDQVDHVDHVEQELQSNTVKPFLHDCSCATTHAHELSLWRWAKSLVWHDRLQTLRQVSNSKWRAWGGLTSFGIVLTLFIAWWISEGIAWYVANPVTLHVSIGKNGFLADKNAQRNVLPPPLCALLTPSLQRQHGRAAIPIRPTNTGLPQFHKDLVAADLVLHILDLHVGLGLFWPY